MEIIAEDRRVHFVAHDGCCTRFCGVNGRHDIVGATRATRDNMDRALQDAYNEIERLREELSRERFVMDNMKTAVERMRSR